MKNVFIIDANLGLINPLLHLTSTVNNDGDLDVVSKVHTFFWTKEQSPILFDESNGSPCEQFIIEYIVILIYVTHTTLI